jgi:hypothetical protein
VVPKRAGESLNKKPLSLNFTLTTHLHAKAVALQTAIAAYLQALKSSLPVWAEATPPNFRNWMTTGDVKAALLLIGISAVLGILVSAILWMIP